LDGQIWALKADSLTSPLIVTVTVTVTENRTLRSHTAGNIFWIPVAI